MLVPVSVVLVVFVAVVHVVRMAATLHGLVPACTVMPVIGMTGVLFVLVHASDDGK